MMEIHSVNYVSLGDWLPLVVMNLFLFGVLIAFVIWDNWQHHRSKRTKFRNQATAIANDRR